VTRGTWDPVGRVGSHNLQRFKNAQNQAESGFQSALAEIEAGAKRGHWIWYVFPQLSGLGSSPMSETYVIADVAEATAYARDPVLCDRLLTITTAVATRLKEGVPVAALMGSRIDALKLVSSLTLFEHVAKQLHASGGDEGHRALAAVAEEVLDLTEAQGYSRCKFTLESLRR
jgi:uncharacterized protein (DUF1810 family)